MTAPACASTAIGPETEEEREALEFWMHECEQQGADDELGDVLDFLRRHERDQVLGITPPSLADIIAALQRGEHRR